MANKDSSFNEDKEEVEPAVSYEVMNQPEEKKEEVNQS